MGLWKCQTIFFKVQLHEFFYVDHLLEDGISGKCMKMLCLTSHCNGASIILSVWTTAMMYMHAYVYGNVSRVGITKITLFTSSAAQGGGGSFNNRKPIGEVGESGMAERSHWWTERCLISLTLSISFSNYLPTYLSIFYVSIYLSVYLSISLSLFHLTTQSIYLSTDLSIYLSLFHLSICLAVYLSIYLSVYLSTCLSVVQCHSGYCSVV